MNGDVLSTEMYLRIMGQHELADNLLRAAVLRNDLRLAEPVLASADDGDDR